MAPKLKSNAVEWLAQQQDLLDLADTDQSRDHIADAMKAAGVLRKETSNHFLRIDLYLSAARAILQSMKTVKVTTVELVRLQRLIESLKHDPYAAEKMHYLIDTWLIRQENK